MNEKLAAQATWDAAATSARFRLDGGRYTVDAPCPRCGALDGWQCHPGEWPVCWRCGVKVLVFGRTPTAACISPNGRIDGHLTYAMFDGDRLVCMFCGES